MTICIGDVHGKYPVYKRILKQFQNTIALGDMGLGFKRHSYHGPSDETYYPNPPYDLMVERGARFIRGNHDNPHVCKNHTQWIADGTIEDNVMFVGGAWSIDKAMRKEGYTWWAEEELSYPELSTVIDIAEKNKPEIMITHDAPEQMVPFIFENMNLHKAMVGTRTGQALEQIRQIVKPKLWVFGHWHHDIDVTIDGTRFVCLNELSCRNVDFKTLEVSDILKYWEADFSTPWEGHANYESMAK